MADFNSSLPVRTETDGDVVARIIGQDNVTIVEVTADGAGNDAMHVQDIDGTAGLLAIETNQTDGSQITQIADGAGDILGVNADGSINVVIQDEGVSSTEIHVFGTTVAGVPSTPNTVVDYTVTVGKTLILKAIQAAASGKFKYELKTGVAAAETTKAVGFGSTSDGSEFIRFIAPIEVAAGEKALLIITNLDKANQDVYGFINGNEV